MIIRKQFKFEAAHIVRGCTSVRCRENIHGHSYIVEVFIEGHKLDQGCMVLDFCLFDGIKELVDSFDHSYCLWADDDKEFKREMYRWNSRVIEMPLSPSAEGYALLFLHAFTDIVSGLELTNGEGEVKLSSVRVHETATGYAEAYASDLEWSNVSSKSLEFSESISNEWRSFKGFK